MAARVSSGAAPPRPVIAFQVGVTGHRALPGTGASALQTQAADLFRQVRDGVERLHTADQAGTVPLYQPSPPILRCICGLAEGADTVLATAALAEGWSLVAVLPFAAEEFARDFMAGPARDRFHALLAQASAVSELDGDRRRGGEPYADIGVQVIEQSDLLLAVWDGLPPRGPGGTGDVVAQALERGLPIAVLPPAGAGPVEWHGCGTVEALLAAALLPPVDPEGFPAAMYADEPRAARWAGAFVRWFEDVVLLGARPSATQPAPEPSAARLPASEARLLPVFDPADRLAGLYAARFRAAGLLRYGLVLPATLGAFVASFGPAPLRPLGVALQFTALIAVIVFSTRGRWARSQRRFIAYRALAEYLRNARLLLPLAAAVRPPGAAVHLAQAADWTAWYGQRSTRAVGLLSTRLDPAAVAGAAAFIRAQAAGQVAYLLGRATCYSALAKRLQRIGLALFSCGVAATAIRTAAMLTAGAPTPLWFDETALILPALAPVFLGLLGFGEYGRLATRYRAVAAELRVQLAVLDAAGLGRAAVLRAARRIANVMLAEGADWQLLIKARTISAL